LTWVRNLALSNHGLPILQQGPNSAPVKGGVNDRDNVGPRWDSRDAAEEKDGGLERAEEEPGPGEEEVPNAAIGEVESLLGPHQNLRVKVT